MVSAAGRKYIFTGAGPRRRVGLLDEVRGLCILLMVAYHAAYDIIYLFGWDIPVFHSALLRFAQPFVAGIFILISGIACRFSRSNLKRGVIALALGLAMSAFTLFFLPQQAIYFGILHLLGSCMTLFALLRGPFDRMAPALGVLIFGALFALTFGLRWGYLGVPGLPELQWSYPQSWMSVKGLIPVGFAFAGADHFPLLPWMFLFFAGTFLGVPFAMNEMPQAFYRTRSRFLALVGRHTIYIYVLHQPVVYGLLWAFFWTLGKLQALF